MERVRVAFAVSKVVFQAHVSGEVVKSFNRLLCYTGFGGVGINFKPFDSKVLSFSVRDIFNRFLMNLSLFLLY